MWVQMVLLMVGLLLGQAVYAEPQSPAPQTELEQVRQAIRAAQADLQQKQAAQKNAQQTLNQAQHALNQAQQDLTHLNRQQRNEWHKFNTLQTELESLKTKVAGAQAQVARLLNSQYRNRQSPAVMLFLQNANPSQKARYLEYSRYIHQANQQVMQDLRRQQEELKQREHAIDKSLTQLQQLKRQKEATFKQLGRTTSNAQNESEQLRTQIHNQTQHLARLRAAEARLNQILSEITRRNAAKRKQEAVARNQAAQQRLAKTKPTAPKPKANAPTAPHETHASESQAKAAEPAAVSTLTEEDRALQAPYENPSVNQFSRLQGRLPRPINGTLSGRFGQTRPNGGTWRGVFYATAPSGVRSIAAGTVAYAGHLSGYGNTIVIDHGGDYTSIYTGLSSIGVGNGSKVSAGSTLGSSGSLASGEQGLYFEIRYRNTAMNPLSWLR